MGKSDALFVLAMTLVGCSRTKPPPKPGNPDSAENQAILVKLQGYLECFHQHSEHVFQVADLYAARLDNHPPNAEPVMVLPATSDPEKCLEAIKEARNIPPSLPELESAADAFSKALATTFTLTSEARDHYGRTSKDHDPAKRLALRPTLTAAFAQFTQAQGVFFDQVSRVNRQVRLDQLARREKVEGRTIGLLVDLMMLHAEELVRLGATRSDDLDAIDLPAFEARLVAFEDILDEMNAHALSNPKETETKMQGFSILASTSLAYKMSARQLLHRTRDRIPFAETEKIQIGAGDESAVAGTPAAMIKAYNHLVAIYFVR